MERHIIFGAAYYEEYLPYDRLERDMEMMAAARHGLDVIVGTPTYAIPPGWPSWIQI